MSKEFLLFDNDEMSFKMKFYRFMDLLVTNKSSSRLESIILLGVFNVQMLAGFFDTNLEVMKVDQNSSDNILNYLYKIIRIRGLLGESYSTFQIAIYLITALVFFFTMCYLIILLKISKSTFYTYKEFLVNFSMKVFLFVAMNPILDLTLANLCFEDRNPNFPTEASCSLTENLVLFIISLLLLLYTIFLAFFLNIFYNDSYFLSNSYYSRMNCGYEIYMTLNSIIYAVLLSQAKHLGKEIFLIYNFLISLIFLKFYFEKYLFYDKNTNTLIGLFHSLYAWTSLFFLIFTFVDLSEKGIIYLIGGVMVVFLFFNVQHKVEENIIMKTPFHKITNKYHLMFYLKNMIDKIHNCDTSIESKAELIGIIEGHINECPNPDCLTKDKTKKIYLPVTEEWSLRDIPEINDKVFLLTFLVTLMNYFISQSYFSPEMLINLSLYYLTIIGNQCQAMFYFRKVKEMKLSLQENFAFTRLSFAISKTLMEKLRPSSEGASNLEDLNTTLYFKYEDLSQKFFDEINNDINLSLEFWKTFKAHHQRRTLDFNKVFNLTDKIRLTKTKIEKIWNSLFSTYSGVNDLYELYENYVEQINDDDMLKRELDAVKSKMTSATDHIQVNYYNLLFNKETGIIIANGDKSKEGIIEKTNDEVEKIFEYKSDELKGMNVSHLMPRIFEKQHKSFMERFFDVGEKRRVDKQFRSFAKDRENCLLPIKLHLKLFPMLNDNIYFVSMIVRENLDDVILIDSKFNIQGISRKLMSKFELENRNIFNDCDIPFYIICKKFVNFYKTFLRNQKKHKRENKKAVGHSSVINPLLAENSSDNFASDNDMNKHKVSTPVIRIIPSDTKIGNSNANINTNNGLNEILGLEGQRNLLDDDQILANINENIEITENTELEYEVAIPQFLQDYVSSINRRDNKLDVKLLKTNTMDSHRDKDGDTTHDDFGEDENLVKETPTVNEETTGKDSSPRKNFNKQSDEEKEFQTRIKQYRTLFETGRYNELLELLTKMNQEGQTKDYKFNFTFDRHRFGDGNIAYVIRCIDNKNDYEGSDTMSGENQNEKDKHCRQLKDKIDALKDITEVTTEDKSEILEKSADFVRLSIEDREFQKNLSAYKDEISMSSKVFGIKHEDTNMEDENSSQSSNASFNDNIAKKSRIEEIRSNLLQNVSNFHLLKWIKAIFYIIILITAAFCGLYLMVFDIIHKDLNNISELNIGLFQSTIWMSNSISTLISLRSYYRLSKSDSLISYNSYIPDQIEYYETLQVFTTGWYNQVMNIFGNIENKINLYFDENNDQIDFWSKKNISYPKVNGLSPLSDGESFPMTLSQVLSGFMESVQNPYFFPLPEQTEDQVPAHMEDLINYACFISIENAIDNLLPRQFNILAKAPSLFQELNKDNMRYVITIMATYTLTIILLVFIYAIILYLTNKTMEEGLEKVSKIKSEKIEETIKKIETFNEKSLSKYRQKDTKFHEDRDFKYENSTSSALMNENRFSINDGKNFKSLKVLSYSYLHVAEIILILCAFLLPIYFVSLQIIESTNQILSVQNYIFWKSLTASASTVDIKCLISECQLEKEFKYDIEYVERSEIESIVRDISNFPELSDFYSNKFLLNACSVIFSVNDTRYKDCMSDVYIRSANNTDSLLKLVEETVSTIKKDRSMKLDLPYKMKDGTITEFANPMLFETKHFRDLEYIFYKYITPISDSFTEVVSLTLTNYVEGEKVKIIILICVFGAVILVFSFYIAFIFTKRLVHLLSVSRCILRIIPTSVINSTQELETWIENKY